MAFRQLTDIAADVVAVVEATGKFKSVTWAAINNHKQLMECAANIPTVPKAIVCIGSGKFDKYATLRKFDLAIVVFAKFNTVTKQADAVWTLAEAAAAPFLPQFPVDENGNDLPPVFPEINGVKYELQSWAPLETDNRTASFVIELETVEVYKYAG